MAAPPERLTTDDLQYLATLNGLDLTPELEPLVLAELNSLFANLRLIDALLPAPTPAAAQPYDPTFPRVQLPEETAE